MVSIDEYEVILLIIKLVIILINLILLAENYFKNKNYKSFEKYLMIFFAGIYILIFAIRPVLPYSDTAVYLYKYEYNLKSLDDILQGGKDIFFFVYSYISKIIIDDKTVYLFSVALAYLGPLIFALKKFKHPFLLFSLFTLTFSFENLGINIIRQGIGLSFFTLGIVLFFNKLKNSYIYFLLAVLFHISLVIPVGIFLIFRRVKNIYLSAVVLLICSVLSISNINVIGFVENIPIISEIFKERNQNYSEVVANYKVGFRPDFFIYNYLFIIFGYFTYIKFKFLDIDYKNKYLLVLNTYIVLSSVFFLMFTQSFSDRYGVLSWYLVPFLFLPYIQQTKSRIGLINSATIFIFYAAISLFFTLK
ncbi:EpsG family protein [Empedobacter falsenii]|uniref:EpsG family protein n=1 Tax=Empedobacter falsenii TaxID=343874 RepID=UPI003A7F6B7E